jgi:hypothetical protein
MYSRRETANEELVPPDHSPIGIGRARTAADSEKVGRVVFADYVIDGDERGGFGQGAAEFPLRYAPTLPNIPRLISHLDNAVQDRNCLPKSARQFGTAIHFLIHCCRARDEGALKDRPIRVMGCRK